MRKRAEIPVPTQENMSRNYDSAEFTVANGLTNYDVRANESSAFNNLKSYTTIVVRSDQKITIKLNSTSNDAITIEDGMPFTAEELMEIHEIYITNASGSTANVKIIGIKKGV